jgi:HAD superfamily hydrolase (TIGR01509 family)
VPALIFDCDGVLADTERYGHLPAFNATFAEFALPVHWTDEDYAKKVLIGGGKERLASLLTPEFVKATGISDDPAEQRASVASWHRRKTELYTAMVEEGALPARPGVARIVGEAHHAGWQLAVASTSAEPSVRAVLEHVVGHRMAAHFAVFAGDIVAAKKPAPDIYELALRELGVGADESIVVEDSGNGLRAALAAGIRTIVTVSDYTRHEDFDGAAFVASSLGSPEIDTEVIASESGVRPHGVVRLSDLEAVLAAPHSSDSPATKESL